MRELYVVFLLAFLARMEIIKVNYNAEQQVKWMRKKFSIWLIKFLCFSGEIWYFGMDGYETGSDISCNFAFIEIFINF